MMLAGLFYEVWKVWLTGAAVVMLLLAAIARVVRD